MPHAGHTRSNSGLKVQSGLHKGVMVTADLGPKQFMVPCPGCATGLPIEEGGPETTHVRCPGCSRLVIIVWTDTAFLVTFSEWAGQENSEGWGLPPDPL